MTGFGELVEVGARCCIGLVFLAAALSKIRRRADFADFRASVAALSPVSGRATRRLPEALLLAELAAAVSLALPWVRLGFWLALALLVAFTAAMARAKVRGVRAACRCFGGSAAPVGARHLVRNALLIAIAAGGLLAASPDGRVPAAAAATAAGAGVLAAAVLMVLDDVLDLFAGQPTVERVR